ncbi:MAG: hypothetical protein U0Q16_19595 [Bryobacteraceae bacterium]
MATRCRDLRPVVFRSPGLDWRHLAASCAIPFLLPAVEIDRVRYWDGGFWGALPLWAAYEAGATDILAIHCIPRLAWPLQPILAGLRRFGAPKSEQPAGVRVRVVAPETPLDSALRGLSRDPDRIHAWVGRGVRDARKWVELHPS